MTRKMRMLIVIGLSVFLLTGCGGTSGEKLTCSDTNERLTEEITYTFKDDKVSKVKVVYTSEQDSAEDAEANKDNMVTFMDLAFGSSSSGNYTYEVTTKGNKIILTMDVDYEKASDELKEILGTGSKEEIKEATEENGSTCK